MGTLTVKPLETSYAGYRFRSRTEARWAVYFDYLKIVWEYEKEGYRLPGLGAYLPDFWLPQVSMWAEVKPGNFTEWEEKKCQALAALTGYPVLMLDGSPEAKSYWGKLPHFGEVDYILGTEYVVSEHRFYSNTAGIEVDDDHILEAIYAARAARFERWG